MENEALHLVQHKGLIDRHDRHRLNRHKSCVVWLTGLSGAGKSTVAHALEEKLYAMEIRSYVLDGDNVRRGLNADLGFSREDRQENIRRIVEAAKLFLDAGLVTITAFISPYADDRVFARRSFATGDFYEVFVKCPIEVCERRDPKGQYAKARGGIIKGYTGIASPYEEPCNPDLVLETDLLNIDECVGRVLRVLHEGEILPPGGLNAEL